MLYLIADLLLKHIVGLLHLRRSCNLPHKSFLPFDPKGVISKANVSKNPLYKPLDHYDRFTLGNAYFTDIESQIFRRVQKKLPNAWSKHNRPERKAVKSVPRQMPGNITLLGSTRLQETNYNSIMESLAPDAWNANSMKWMSHIYGDGTTYEGFMLNGIPHIQGTVVFGDGTGYKTAWPQAGWLYINIRNRKIAGKLSFPNEIGSHVFRPSITEAQPKPGDKYEGQFEFGFPHGLGRYSTVDGRVYVGQYWGGVFRGHGAVFDLSPLRERVKTGEDLNRAWVQTRPLVQGTAQYGVWCMHPTDKIQKPVTTRLKRRRDCWVPNMSPPLARRMVLTKGTTWLQNMLQPFEVLQHKYGFQKRKGESRWAARKRLIENDSRVSKCMVGLVQEVVDDVRMLQHKPQGDAGLRKCRNHHEIPLQRWQDPLYYTIGTRFLMPGLRGLCHKAPQDPNVEAMLSQARRQWKKVFDRNNQPLADHVKIRELANVRPGFESYQSRFLRATKRCCEHASLSSSTGMG
eukprot:gnl/MRDRNA2_/MRDRNA2_36363_c0_seq1.p1 gnl/MRDRNA2_/MRDRNA2_36363_c0~~gnl/MRDRNA2_/MRDRNA2_36363_c0_seq1.p1  ORF type:complete len:516 (+),score=41.94 gnl/MRDRNA2_/MRDRNA2_36363_c0_seq1:155-1702(+)